MSIVIGDRNARACFITKKSLKVNARQLQPRACRVGCLVKAQSYALRGGSCASHIYPMFESGHQTPYLRSPNT